MKVEMKMKIEMEVKIIQTCCFSGNVRFTLENIQRWKKVFSHSIKYYRYFELFKLRETKLYNSYKTSA